MPGSRIALVGDFSPDVLAHQAINQCFALTRQSHAYPIEHQWLPTEGHPFFVGTQFQPERRALQGSIHPLVSSFFVYCASNSAGGSGPPGLGIGIA